MRSTGHNSQREVPTNQPRPQGLLLVQNGGRRNPRPRLPKWLQTFIRISSRKHDEMSAFRLNNGFRLQKTNRAARHWKQRPKKPFYHVSRDKILHDSWSISAALARGFSDRHFERGEGPGDEVADKYYGNLHLHFFFLLKMLFIYLFVYLFIYLFIYVWHGSSTTYECKVCYYCEVEQSLPHYVVVAQL